MALEFGNVSKTDAYIDYSKINIADTLKKADEAFYKAYNLKNYSLKCKLYSNALGLYYVVTKVFPTDDYAMIQMARIYDYLKKDSYSKSYFSRALRTHIDCPDANFYLGDFYYSRAEYKKALTLYERSEKFGFKDKKAVYIKLARLYEKLGDNNKALVYYEKILKIMPKNNEVKSKISNIKSLNNVNYRGYGRKY